MENVLINLMTIKTHIMVLADRAGLALWDNRHLRTVSLGGTTMFARCILSMTGVLLGVSLSSQALAVQFDSNVPLAIQTQMNADLGFMNSLEGQYKTAFHQQIFGAFGGNSYKKFFESHILEVGLDGCGLGNAVACVKPWAGKKMFLTNNFIKFSHPQIARMMVAYHEARHTEIENGSWAHDTCPTPFVNDDGSEKRSIWTGASLAGEKACDSTALGSYGSSTILLKNVALFCTNCTDKVKMDADLYATDQLGRIDEPAVKKAMLADFNGKQ